MAPNPIYLNTLSPDDRTASERLGGVAMLVEVCHWGGLVLYVLLVRGELSAAAPTDCYHLSLLSHLGS